EKKGKTDKADALKLARNHSNHELIGIDVPDEIHQEQRSLVRYRTRLAGDITRSKNRLKSLLKYQGIDIPHQLDKPGNRSCNFMNRIEQQAGKDALPKDSLLLMPSAAVCCVNCC
ncbi:IS110 family transposase, partial [Parafilimonas sp.]|uniref:IS110 family transposase n=1 Tax=Parafilimonas sp. TaxID=1969739 RepID=UPI0039E308A2